MRIVRVSLVLQENKQRNKVDFFWNESLGNRRLLRPKAPRPECNRDLSAARSGKLRSSRVDLRSFFSRLKSFKHTPCTPNTSNPSRDC